MFKAKTKTTRNRTAATISSTTAAASTSTSRQPQATASLVRKRKQTVEENGKGCNRVKTKKRKTNNEEKEKKTSSSASANSRKRKSTQNQGNGHQDGTARKKSKSSPLSSDTEEDEEDSSQIFDVQNRRTRRALAAAQRDDPNQTVKTSFSRPTRMPKGENNFLKKIVSLYFRCCFLQECYNLMIIKNLATLLANYIFYKTALDPSRSEEATSPKIEQDFFYRCLSTFNSNSDGIQIPNSPMKIPKAFEHSLGHIFLEFAAHSCPRQLNLKLVFKHSLNIVARQLITNTNEMFRTRTTTIIKKLVIYLNPHVTTRMAGFIANSLLEREFGLQKMNNRTPLQFRNEAAASAYNSTSEAFKAYSRKATEAERWLFFHGELFKRDYDYIDNFTTKFQWLPLCKPSKRPHVHLNKTLLKSVFPGKLGDLLRTLKKFEDPFDVFNYPRHRSLESPLEKYLYVNESHICSSSTKMKRKRTHERNRRILQNLAHKVEKFKELFPTGKKVLSKESKQYLRSHFRISSEIKDIAIDWESLQNKLRWEYVLPNIKNVLKPNVLRCFDQFERISTNGVDMSFSIYKESKESTTERLQPADLVKEDLQGKLLIGVDPGVRSLATCTYSSHLEGKTGNVNQIFVSKRKEKPWSTRISSKEIWHKTNIACSPLRNLHLHGQETVKRRLMEIPWAKSHYSTYPNHLQQQQSQSIEEYNRNKTRFYVKSSRVFFRSPCKRWKWFSYRYLQASQYALAKRILTPVLCKNKKEFQTAVDQVRSEMKANQQMNQQYSRNNIRNLVRKPWMEDLLVFKKLKNHHSISNIWSKVVVAFGNQCRNPTIVRGHYKTSCEKLCNSLEQLVKRFDGDVVDASEYLTSQRCHRCLSLVSENHDVNDDIEQKPIGVLKEDSIKYKRRFEGISKTILLKGIDGVNMDKLSSGPRRSKHELRSCVNCSTIFNRDVNASVNIMNLFICNVNQMELFSQN